MNYIKRLQAAAKRNYEIKSLFAAGMTKAALARRFGISRERISQILKKDTA